MPRRDGAGRVVPGDGSHGPSAASKADGIVRDDAREGSGDESAWGPVVHHDGVGEVSMPPGGLASIDRDRDRRRRAPRRVPVPPGFYAATGALRRERRPAPACRRRVGSKLHVTLRVIDCGRRARRGRTPGSQRRTALGSPARRTRRDGFHGCAGLAEPTAVATGRRASGRGCGRTRPDHPPWSGGADEEGSKYGPDGPQPHVSCGAPAGAETAALTGLRWGRPASTGPFWLISGGVLGRYDLLARV